VLRVDIIGDVDVAAWPDASYYDDGTVIIPGEVGEVVVRRLTASGLAELLRGVEASGLFDRSRQFVALHPNRGLVGYTVDVVLPGRSPVQATAAINAEVTDDTAKFVALAHDLADPVGSLPPSAWADPGPQPFVPALVRVGTVIEAVTDAPWPVDIADVDWPLAQPFDGLGEVLDESESPGYTARCAVLSASDVGAIRAAFAAAGVKAERDWVRTTALRFGGDRSIRFEFVDLLPDGVPGCAAPEGAAWWAQGAEFAYGRGGSGVIRLLNRSSGTDERLATGEASAWAPDGERLALIRPRSGGQSDLWLLDVASGQERRVVEDVWRTAGWSPAGDALAINRSPVDLGETWLVNPDGSGLRRLAAGGNATWSPDGRSLAIVSGSAVPMVTLVEVATGRLAELAKGTSPAWTGEARPRIAFVEWGTDQVALVDPVTRVVSRLTALEAPAAHLVRVPAPTTAGWALAFVSGGKPWVLDGIDAVARTLSVGAVVDGAVSAGPDGTWYAVVGRDGDASNLYLVRADGDGWFRLTESGDVREAAWRPSQ